MLSQEKPTNTGDQGNMKTITLKVGNMNKAQVFVVYPDSTIPENNAHFKLQSDKRMAFVNRQTGKGIITKKGCFFVHTQVPGNTVDIQVSPEVLAEIAACQPHSGDRIGSLGGVSVIIA
jgi:hypothetical protein